MSSKIGLDIPPGCRRIQDHEKAGFHARIDHCIRIIDVPDETFPKRQIEVAMTGYANRILLAPVALGHSNNGSWNEEKVDSFFGTTMNSDCIFWSKQMDEEREIIFVGKYSKNNRRWLREYSILNNMPSVGFTSINFDASIISDIDCDYTIIAASQELIEVFDQICGGKNLLCEDLMAGLRANDDHYGSRNPFGFMSKYFPEISNCI